MKNLDPVWKNIINIFFYEIKQLNPKKKISKDKYRYQQKIKKTT
jgi:hypothetical protein